MSGTATLEREQYSLLVGKGLRGTLGFLLKRFLASPPFRGAWMGLLIDKVYSRKVFNGDFLP